MGTEHYDEDIVDLQKLIIPEIGQLIETRYEILSVIHSEEPIGRRSLAYLLDVSERQIRNEIDFLQEQNLIKVERQGVCLTEKGVQILPNLNYMLYQYNGLEVIERELEKVLNLKKCIVVPGDLDKNVKVLQFMGAAAGKYILSKLKRGDEVIALTGGRSTGAVANQMRKGHYEDVYVIPARGGIGLHHSIQANNIVAELALKLDCKYELLHLPDNIDPRLLSALKDYQEVQRVFDKMKEIDILLFGIGRADVMTSWRNLSMVERKRLIDDGAMAEAFGHYFNKDGEIVSPSSSIGISMETYKKTPYPIAIAGGSNKCEAIEAVVKVRPEMILVTDERVANLLLNRHKNQVNK
jgi:central glycolytic genes regulator